MSDLSSRITPEVEARVKWREPHECGQHPHEGEDYCPIAAEAWDNPSGYVSWDPDWKRWDVDGGDYFASCSERWAPLTEVMEAYAAVQVERELARLLDPMISRAIVGPRACQECGEWTAEFCSAECSDRFDGAPNIPRPIDIPAEPDTVSGPDEAEGAEGCSVKAIEAMVQRHLAVSPVLPSDAPPEPGPANPEILRTAHKMWSRDLAWLKGQPWPQQAPEPPDDSE